MQMKVCGGKCKLEKPANQFNWKNKQKRQLFYACKECWNEQNRQRYKENKQYYVDKATKNKKLAKAILYSKMLSYLSDKCCLDCGEKDAVVLQFDHVRGTKVDNVSKLIGQGFSWETVFAEIEKCEIRCANCHQRKTAKQFNWYSCSPR